MFPASGWPLSEPELEFLESLLRDIEPLGFEFTNDGNRIHFKQRAPLARFSYREFYREAHFRIHRKHLNENLPSILAFETDYGPTAFIEGDGLDFRAIDPILRPVDLRGPANPSRRDRAIVDYLRQYQVVSSHRSVGRENVYILEDHGHSRAPVMGVLVLASPRYYQPHRDAVLGWATPRDLAAASKTRQTRLIRTRESGLNRTMQVAICCALPPYSLLGAASLLAVAPFVRSVQDDFRDRWYDRRFNRDPDLCAVTTTTSMGLTGTPFQALYSGLFYDRMISQQKGEKWNAHNTLYARIGTRHPWLPGIIVRAKSPYVDFQGLVTTETWCLALKAAGKDARATSKHLNWRLEGLSQSTRNHLLRSMVQQVGLNPLMFRGNPVGVFLGAIDKPSLESLRDGRGRCNRPILSWEMAVARFKREFDIHEAANSKDDRRRRAVRNRLERARLTTLGDILLSHRLDRERL